MKVGKERKKTKDGVKILRKIIIKDDPKRLKQIEKIKEDLDIAEQIYKLRTKANLTQKELAELIGTSQSDISRLENADYDGYSFKMLQKIAAAVNCRLQIKFIPEKKLHTYA